MCSVGSLLSVPGREWRANGSQQAAQWREPFSVAYYLFLIRTFNVLSPDIFTDEIGLPFVANVRLQLLFERN